LVKGLDLLHAVLGLDLADGFATRFKHDISSSWNGSRGLISIVALLPVDVEETVWELGSNIESRAIKGDLAGDLLGVHCPSEELSLEVPDTFMGVDPPVVRIGTVEIEPKIFSN